MPHSRIAGVLALLFVLGLGPALAQEPKVALQVVKYDGLKQAIVQNRGKVVFVDFWGFF
jgi:hypothetical protein